MDIEYNHQEEAARAGLTPKRWDITVQDIDSASIRHIIKSRAGEGKATDLVNGLRVGAAGAFESMVTAEAASDIRIKISDKASGTPLPEGFKRPQHPGGISPVEVMPGLRDVTFYEDIHFSVRH